MALGIFGEKKKLAKVNSTLMISLETEKAKQRQSFDLAIKKWNHHVKTHHLHGLHYNDKHNTKKKSVCYFSPYTFDCFLKYLNDLINIGTVIPRTNGKTLNGFRVTTKIFDNVPATNKNNHVLYNKKGQLYVTQVNQVKKYPDVLYNNSYDYASFIIYNLLFFSYSQEALDNQGNKLRSLYNENKTIAKEFKGAFLQEYRDVNHKSLPKGDFVHLPSFKSFTDINKDDLYIPNLTTKKQKAYAKRKIRNNNVSIYNIDSQNNNRNAVLKTATIWKEMHEKDKRVGQLLNGKHLKAVRQSKREEQKSSEAQQLHQQRAREWRSSVAQVAESDEAKNQKSNSSSSSSNNYNHNLNVPANSSSSESAVTTSNSQSAELSSKRAAFEKAFKSNAEEKKKGQTSSAKSPSGNKSKSASSNSSANNNQHNMHINSNQANHSEQNTGNIDYSSVKQPFILTNDPGILSKAIKSMVTNNDLNVIKPIHFHLMSINKNLPAPEAPEVAIRTNQLGDQRYVQEEANEFKKIANSFIKHEEYDLNLAERHDEIKSIKKSYEILTNKIQGLVDKYSDDLALEENAAKYYKVNYHKALINLQKSRDKELKTTRQALIEEFHGRYNRAQVRIYRYFDKEQRTIEDSLNENTISVYNDSRTRRDKEIHKLIRGKKRDVNHTLYINLQQQHNKFKKHASEINQLLYGFFNRQLKKNKKNWISTVSKMIEAEVKRDNAKTKLRQATIEANHTKNGSAKQAQLAQEIQQAREFADQSEQEVQRGQQRFLNIRTKLINQADKNASLRNQIDDLKENISTNSEEARQDLDSSRNSVKRLQHSITLKNQRAQKLNDEVTKLTQSRENATDSLMEVKNSLEATQMRTSQYKQMLDHQRSQTYNQSQKLASLEQKYTNVSLIAENNNATRASARAEIQKASQENAASSASIARSISASFDASVATQNSFQNTSFTNIRQSLSVKNSIANSKVAQARAQASNARKLAQENSASVQASLSRQASLDSVASQSLSTSASIAQSTAISVAQSSVMVSTKASLSASRATVKSYANAQALQSASIAKSSVASVKASASQAVKSAHEAQIKNIKATKAHTKARSQAKAQAESKMASYKSSSAIANSLAMSASSSTSKSIASSVSAQEQQTSQATPNTKETLQSIKASVMASASLSASASVAKVEISNRASISASKKASAQAKAITSRNTSTNDTQAEEKAHQNAVNFGDYTPKVSAKERVQQMTINDLKRKMSRISAQERRKSSKHGHHRHFWQI